MPELNFKITGDDSSLRKTLSNVGKLVADENAKIQKEINKRLEEEEKKRQKTIKATQDQTKASGGVVTAVNEETKAHERATAAIKRKTAAFDANGRQLRPFTFSNTQDEVDAANIGRVGTIPSGTVVGPGLDYNKLASEARGYGEIVRQAHNAAVTGATRTVKANEDIQKAIRDLRIQTQSYEGVIGKTKDYEVLAKYNKKIVETQAEIARLRNVGKAGFDELGNKLTVTAGKMEILNKKLQVYREGLMKAQAPQSFVNLNRKIQDTEIQLNQLKNVGKKGFDELGNAVKGSTNILGSLWSGLKLAANILPGIGIAGILAFAAEPIIKYISKLDLFKKALSQAAANLEVLNSVQKSANSQAGSQITSLRILYNAAVDVSNSTQDRTSAAQELKKEFPQAFANSKLTTILNGEESKSYTQLTADILENARAKAAADKIADLSAKKLDSDFKKQKIRNAQAAELARVTGNKATVQFGGSSIAISTDEQKRFINDRANTALKTEEANDKILDGQIDFLTAYAKGGAKLASAIIGNANLIKEPLKNFNSLLQSVSSKNDIDNIKNALQSKLNALAPNDKQIAVYQSKIRQLQELEKKYSPKTTDGKADLRAENAIQKQSEALQSRIDGINAEYTRKSSTKDEEEMQAVRDKFKKIADEAAKFNANPKNKLNLVDTSKLEETKNSAIGDLLYRQNTAKFEIQINKQKELYEDFERWKQIFGVDSANKRFKGELDTSTTYLEKLKDRYSKLIFKSVVGTITGKPTLTGPEQEDLDLGSKRIEAANKQIKAKRDTDYADAYQAALTFNQRIDKINAEYRKKAADLGPEITDNQKIEINQLRDNAINAAKDEALAKTAIYKKLAEETIQLTRSQVNEQIKALEGIMRTGSLPGDVNAKVQGQLSALKVTLKIGVDQANLNNLKTEYQNVLAELNATDAKGDSIVSEDAKKRILKRLVEIKTKIDSIDNDGNSIASWGDKVAKNFDYLSGSSLEFADSMSKDLSRLSSGFSELSSAVGGNDTQAGYLLDTISQLTKAGSEAAGAFVSFASGDIIGGITKTMSAVASVLSIGKKVKEMNAAARKEVSDFYAAAIKGETEYQALLRQRELDTAARGKNSYRAIIDQLDAIKKQSPEIQKAYDAIFSSLQGQEYKEGMGSEHGTWFRKAKTWDIMASLFGSDYDNLEKLDTQGKLIGDTKAQFDDLKKLREELDAAGVSAEDLKKQLGELLTGTSTSGLADGLKSLFENGKRSAQDFGDSFEEIMRNALLNTFKAKFLDDALQPFYEELAAMMEAGTPTESQIAALKEKYIKLGQDADTYLDTVEKVTGVDLSDSTSKDSALKKGITAITSDQASALEGINRGQYEYLQLINGNQVSGNSIAQQNLDVSMQNLRWAEQTAANTLRTANNTDQLSQLSTIDASLNTIAKNTTSGSLRGAGLG